jgi:hypothetical protein
MRFKLSGMISMKDNYTAVVQTAAKATTNFKKEIQDASEKMDEMQKANKKMRLDIKTAALERKLTKVKKKMDPFRKKIITVLAYKDHLSKRLAKAKNKLKALVRKPFMPVIALKDKISGKIGAIKGKLGGLLGVAGKVGGVVAAAMGAVGGMALKGSMTLEQQQVSMKHFIGVSNEGMSDTDVQKKSDDYMGWLRKNANSTPFATNEIVAAGSRAVQVSEGDTGMAQQLVQMAENMAALTPGKTVEEAMEALADAKMGEMERLKEFGFKVGQDEFSAAGGDLLKLKGKNGKGMADFFDGGADKLAQTAAGKASTIKGTLQTILVDGIGTPLREAMTSGPLGGIADWLVEKQPALTAGAQKITNGIINLKNKAVELGKKWKPTFVEIGTRLKWTWDKFLKPVLTTAWSLIKMVGAIAKTVWDKLAPIFDSMWEKLKPIVEGMGNVASWVGDKAEKFTDWIGGGGDDEPTPHAAGIPYVPYDGYLARLHRGERVVTAQDNQQQGHGGGGIQIIIPKLADQINASNPLDIENLLIKLEDKVLEAALCAGRA